MSAWGFNLLKLTAYRVTKKTLSEPKVQRTSRRRKAHPRDALRAVREDAVQVRRPLRDPIPRLY